MAHANDEVADRSAITDLYARYCWALSTHDWDAMDSMYVDSATIDATALGGEKLRWPELKARYAESRSEHRIFCTATSIVIDLDGDVANVVAAFLANVSFPGGDDTRVELSEGGWLVDRLQRTVNGWRVTERVYRVGFQTTTNIPASP